MRADPLAGAVSKLGEFASLARRTVWKTAKLASQGYCPSHM